MVSRHNTRYGLAQNLRGMKDFADFLFVLHGGENNIWGAPVVDGGMIIVLMQRFRKRSAKAPYILRLLFFGQQSMSAEGKILHGEGLIAGIIAKSGI